VTRRSERRPKPWRQGKTFAVGKLNRHIAAWAAYLGLADWDIAFSTTRVDKGCRSNVDIDMLQRRAAIRINSKTPVSGFDRQIVHELLHVLFAGMEDAFNVSASQQKLPARRILARYWKRQDEWVVERLTDILSGVPRIEWGAPQVWREAFGE